MNVLLFIMKYGDVIVASLAAILGLAVAYKKRNLAGVKQMLFYVITAAEQEYGKGFGLVKKSEVAEFVWQHIPAPLQIIVSTKDVENLIEKALEDARGKWAQNASLEAYINNEEPPLQVK